ncbi:hypothetical protein P7K49_002103 [Saguinus oedipus]|uniref:Uncharacterized protein n=1 Tax=Saguinus oedipus TaxID=9490 RepID=A0ABQ9WGB4_SAGOE|nr:hypothetical protein P7K49_002103 [Saguinus oedipus]
MTSAEDRQGVWVVRAPVRARVRCPAPAGAPGLGGSGSLHARGGQNRGQPDSIPEEEQQAHHSTDCPEQATG